MLLDTLLLNLLGLSQAIKVACAAESHVQQECCFGLIHNSQLRAGQGPGFDSALANDYLQPREPQEAYQVCPIASVAVLQVIPPLPLASHHSTGVKKTLFPSASGLSIRLTTNNNNCLVLLVLSNATTDLNHCTAPTVTSSHNINQLCNTIQKRKDALLPSHLFCSS